MENIKTFVTTDLSNNFEWKIVYLIIVDTANGPMFGILKKLKPL